MKEQPGTMTDDPLPSSTRHPFPSTLQYVLTHCTWRESQMLADGFWLLSGATGAAIYLTAGHCLTVWLSLFLLALGGLGGWILADQLVPAAREEWIYSWAFIFGGLAAFLYDLTLLILPGNLLRTVLQAGLWFLFGMVAGIMACALLRFMSRVTWPQVQTRIRAWWVISTLIDLAVAAGGLILLGPGPRGSGWILGAVGTAGILLGLVTIVVRHQRIRVRLTLRQFLCLHGFHFYCYFWQRAKVYGKCRVPRNRPVILVCNHISPVDPLLLHTLLGDRAPAWFIAREQYEFWLLKPIYDLWHCIPINRTGQETAGFRAALRWLKAGGAMGIFPQGGIPDPGQILPIKTGPAVLALASGAVLQTAYVWGVPPSEITLAPLWRRANIRVRLGEKIDVAKDYVGREKDKSAAQELTDRLWSAIQGLKEAEGRE